MEHLYDLTRFSSDAARRAVSLKQLSLLLQLTIRLGVLFGSANQRGNSELQSERKTTYSEGFRTQRYSAASRNCVRAGVVTAATMVGGGNVVTCACLFLYLIDSTITQQVLGGF